MKLFKCHAVLPLLAYERAHAVRAYVTIAATWQEAVAHHSSTTVRNSHPAYREIIRLGPQVVPLLLRDLQANHTHWFCALREITGANPVPESAAGNIPKIVDAWLRWGREHGYQW